MFHTWIPVASTMVIIISGSSLPVKQATKATGSSQKEEEEGERGDKESTTGAITLAVPTLPGTTTTTNGSSSEPSDYLVTTYNSVTGWETSV